MPQRRGRYPPLPNFQGDGLDAERAGRGPTSSSSACSVDTGIGHDRHRRPGTTRTRVSGASPKARRRKRQAGDVAGRPRETGDKASAKRVRHRRDHVGRTEVAGSAAKTGGSAVTITSTLRRQTRRRSRRTLVASLRTANLDDDGTASIHPSSRSRCSKAATHWPAAARACPLRTDDRQLPDRCARAASGHAKAPPRRVMKSRLSWAPLLRAGAAITTPLHENPEKLRSSKSFPACRQPVRQRGRTSLQCDERTWP